MDEIAIKEPRTEEEMENAADLLKLVMVRTVTRLFYLHKVLRVMQVRLNNLASALTTVSVFCRPKCHQQSLAYKHE